MKDSKNIKRLTDLGLETLNKIKLMMMEQYVKEKRTDFPSDAKILEYALCCFEMHIEEDNGIK